MGVAAPHLLARLLWPTCGPLICALPSAAAIRPQLCVINASTRQRRRVCVYPMQARRREMVRQERMEHEAKQQELDVEFEVSAPASLP